MRIKRVPEASAWQACLDAQPTATVFHQWDWLQLMAQGMGNIFLPLGFYADNQLVGLAPLLIKQLGLYRNANWSPFPYLGPVVPRNLQPEALSALDHYQYRNGIGLIQLGFAPHAAVDVPLLRAHGYAVHLHTTMLVQLDGRDDAALLAGMSAKRRSRLRRAERAGITVRTSTEREVCIEMNNVLAEVFSAQDMPPAYPRDVPRLVWQRFGKDPRARLTTALYRGELAAMAITLHDGVRAYSWQAAGFHQYRQFNALAVLYWDALRWARDQRCQVFDMVGTPSPTIADYKHQFGADEVSYAVAWRTNSSIMAVLRASHGLLLRQVRTRINRGPGPREANRSGEIN